MEKELDNNSFKDEKEVFSGSFYKYYGVNEGNKCCKENNGKKSEVCTECETCRKKREGIFDSRLSGEIFFSSPLNFNDILDSALHVKNNAKALNDDKKLESKLKELYTKVVKNDNSTINETEENVDLEKIKNDLLNLSSDEINNETVKKVREKQLEKIGIMCFTDSNESSNMWGLYTNNRGYCIEYDSKNLLFDITIGFVSQMTPEMTRFLIDEKKYCKKNRDKGNKPKRTEHAREIFGDKFNREIIELLKNNEILSKKSEEKQLYFVQNIYTKRLWGRGVKYKEREEMNKLKPTLFNDNTESTVSGKYFAKEKFWEHENEYRFILSLGGNTVIPLRKGTIKSITMGYCISDKSKDMISKHCKKEKITLNKIKINEDNQLVAEEYKDK